MKLTRRDMLLTIAGSIGIRPLSAAAEPRRLTPPSPPLSRDQTTCLSAAMERLLPGAVEAGGPAYLAFWLKIPVFRVVNTLFAHGAAALDETARRKSKRPFAELDGAAKDDILREFIAKKAAVNVNTRLFVEQLMELTIEGYLADPKYGGNRNRAGWRFIGIPDGLQSCWWNPNGMFTVLGPKPKFTD